MSSDVKVIAFRVSEDFYYKKNVSINSWLESAKELDEASPWSSSVKLDQFFIDFRRRSCDKNSFNGAFDGPDEYNPSILQYDEWNRFQPVDGLTVLVHSPNEYPLNNFQLFYQKHWAFNLATISPERFLIDDEMKSWPLEKRNCIMPLEKKLDFFKIYTRSNCEHECLSKYIAEECACVPFYMIRKYAELSIIRISIRIEIMN